MFDSSLSQVNSIWYNTIQSCHPQQWYPHPIYDIYYINYRPGIWPCIIAAFCSWKRSFKRADPLRDLSTQRSTQPSSRETRDLVVKSLTQSSKQRWTSLEYIWDGLATGLETKGCSSTYGHEFFELLPLHARGEFLLLWRIESVEVSGDEMKDSKDPHTRPFCRGGWRWKVAMQVLKLNWTNSGWTRHQVTSPDCWLTRSTSDRTTVDESMFDTRKRRKKRRERQERQERHDESLVESESWGIPCLILLSSCPSSITIVYSILYSILHLLISISNNPSCFQPFLV